MSQYRNERVFLYAYPCGSAQDAHYQHSIVALAEGLRKLKVDFFSNINYWQLFGETEDYLLKYNPEINHHDCSVVVLESHYCRKQGIPQDLFLPNRKYITVFVNSDDGFQGLGFLPEFDKFDIILKPHSNSKIKQLSNHYPWAFGLSERILKATESPTNFTDRKNNLLVNFRHHSILGPHAVRRYVEKNFLPSINEVLFVDRTYESQDVLPSTAYDRLQWVQSGRRHHPSYYKRLQDSMACAAFGGLFFPPFIKNPSSLPRHILCKLWIESGLKSNRVIQWDSWRFWESLAAGCATFHLDFEKYGFLLPEMPQNWQHYIGIDLDNLSATTERLIEEPELLEKIANSGRVWAREKFGLEATARRFLELIRQVRNS